MQEAGYLWNRKRDGDTMGFSEPESDTYYKVKHPVKVAILLIIPIVVAALVGIFAWSVTQINRAGVNGFALLLIGLILFKISAYRLGKTVVAYRAAKAIRKSTWQSMRNY